MKIALYGFMGAGKSTLGKALAETLHYLFVDLDDEIEQFTRMSITEIFEKQGEIAFRRLEHRVLKEIVKRDDDNIVLALGGGAVLSPQNRKLLEVKNFERLYLNVDIDQLLKRLQKEIHKRPLLKNIEKDAFEDFVKALFESRRKQYEAYADIDLEIGSEDFEAVLNRLYLHFNMN